MTTERAVCEKSGFVGLLLRLDRFLDFFAMPQHGTMSRAMEIKIQTDPLPMFLSSVKPSPGESNQIKPA
jgi:hypothetical protein